VNPILVFLLWVHYMLLASLLEWALKKFEPGRTFARQQMRRATATAVAVLYAPALANQFFSWKALFFWHVASHMPAWFMAAWHVIPYALCFPVQWIVFRTCLRDAAGLPMSRRGNLWIAGLSTSLVLGMSLFMLALFALVLITIRGP
jgi:hypothetical protein